MNIHVYTICWNEAPLLPFFIRYYQQFAEKIFFYDNESTDDSKEIITSSDKCYYNSYSSNNEIRDDIYRQIKNDAWKQSRGEADFVIIVDIDEFIYSKSGLLHDLKVLKGLGVTLIRPKGYDMVTKDFDWQSGNQITEMVKTGVPLKLMNKPCIFNPNAIKEINYNWGAHSCLAKGRKIEFRGSLMNGFLGIRLYLLHYKSLGVNYLVKRNNELKHRLSEYNKRKNIATHYLLDDVQIEKEFHNRYSNSAKII